MTFPLSITRHGAVAVLSLNAPPVNALGHAMRSALAEAWRDLEADEGIAALVLTSAGKLFCGGADIAEFGAAMAGPDLPDLLTAIERGRLPTVAAINGAALGGGLELALVCDARFALAGARLGLPEVSLGVIPGAGGTQRLPRLVGMEPAIAMICGGKPIDAGQAQAMGLIDAVCPTVEALMDAALMAARDLATQGVRRNASAAPAPAIPDDPGFAESRRQAVARQAPGRSAPLVAFDRILAAGHLSLEAGLQQEQAAFHACNAGSEARALQHLFLAERKAAQVPGVSGWARGRAVGKMAIVGAGTMGSGIAASCLGAGLAVTLIDVQPEALGRGTEAIARIFAGHVARNRLTQEAADAAMARLVPAADLAAMAEADVVIEAVFENMAVKQKLFREIDALARAGAVLATNTSTLDVDAIAEVTARPADVIGLHFFSPAHVMRLLEIVRARQTAPDVVQTALDLARRIGKVGVVVGVCPGFVGNRMLEPYSREAHRLLLEGATPAQVDGVLTGFGMAMGVLSMCDMAGNDVGALMRKENPAALRRDPSYCRMGDVLAARGDFGQKSGRGFYLHDGRDKRDRPELADWLEAEAAAMGIVRRAIADEEIFERCLYMLVDEGIRVLAEGIAQKPGDIDTIWCNGYGFPAHRGGPMHWAQEHGLARIHNRLQHWRESLGDYGALWFSPSEALTGLAENGGQLTGLAVSR